MTERIACPFCGYQNHEYAVQLHIEEHHTLGSPFITTEDASSHRNAANAVKTPDRSPVDDDAWVRCTRRGCGEYILLSEIDEHLNLHVAMSIVEQDSIANISLPSDRTSPTKSTRGKARSRSSEELRRYSSSSSTSKQDRSRLSGLFSRVYIQNKPSSRPLHQPRNPGRLGKRELGPYAYEERMPSNVRKVLLSGGQPRNVIRIGKNGRLIKESIVPNETQGLVEALADLCSLDKSNDVTYLSHASVRHVERLECDGNFCGYWNIQMLLSYLQHVNPEGPQHIPDVLELQDLIEKAWDNGICSYGKIETGGVRNTRKWIGTHEALAFFTQIGVSVDASCFKDGDKSAVEDLLDHVEALFLSAADDGVRHDKSIITELPPIYLQRLGHSMTIVGIERKKDGSRNLLIFDPSFGTTESMKKLLVRKTIRSSLSTVLGPYRRSDNSMRRWKEFEIIM